MTRVSLLLAGGMIDSTLQDTEDFKEDTPEETWRDGKAQMEIRISETRTGLPGG